MPSLSPRPTDPEQLAIALRETARDLDRAQSGDWHEITQDAVRVLHRLAHLLENPAPSSAPVAVEDVLQALVDEARGDDEWVSGHDLLVRVGAIVMDRLAARSATGEQTDHGGDQ